MGRGKIWGKNSRRPRRPPYRPVTYVPPVWIHNGCLVEYVDHHLPGSECVVYKVIHGHCSTTTIIVLYDPCRHVTFRMPYDTFRRRWRRACRPSWGISQLMRVQCQSPEEVEDGRW